MNKAHAWGILPNLIITWSKAFYFGNLCKEKLIFEGLNIIIIELFKSQKNCINMHDG
jgi:hypothetical protein